ncbi:mechanosensitive ion channel family protein [Aestuariibacter sp. AA17]|uniref:Small-conductance mechanosensitive channel n=1 Tax=Fluctibacter corallii TaxID=2984329 RepID=A0ABT3AA43_9ALTE|nr:mechanosensitive ion channel family protein [Aestuariibacter sp. AA17]MCV2885181.1 mechanosensitive ion channel family protein [Aestuariibacter sp. AA17]
MDPITDILNSARDLLPEIGIGFLILIITFILSAPFANFLTRLVSNVYSSLLIQTVVRRTFRIAFILLGLYLFLQFAGLTSFALAILSGTGVIGLIVGFAFKDIAENFISSLLLSIQRPFKIGDVIEVDGQTGIIKQVTARATTLVDFDGNHIQIPNATIYKNTIKNFTANPNMQSHFMVGIGYDNNIQTAQQIAMSALTSLTPILKEPEPQILVDSLGSATINIKVYFWLNAHDYSVLKVSSLAMRAVTNAFLENNISMPDDAREIVFPEGVPIYRQKHYEPKTNAEASTPTSPPISARAINQIDDVSSSIQEIHNQAQNARDPEQGKNIL